MIPMTLQAVFNGAWQAFIVEGKPPAVRRNPDYGVPGNKDPEFVCCYRTDDGRACAIGLQIPDGHPSLSSPANALALRRDYPALFGDKDLDPEVWRQAQRALHDDLQRIGQWNLTLEQRKAAYVRFADKYRLTIPGEPA